jgi:(2S)-methylsuccinyl-CoA dehydrogenase
MPNTSARPEVGVTLIALAHEATRAAQSILADATAAVRQRLAGAAHTVERLFEREQRATHGLAWLACCVESIRQLAAYAQRMHDAGALGETETLTVEIALGEYLAQMVGGIPMSPGEIVRPADLGLAAAKVAAHIAGPAEGLMTGNGTRRRRLVELMRQHGDGAFGDNGFDDTLALIRSEMRNFAEGEVRPHANEWHLLNSFIPLPVIAQMAELGVFGLTIPESYGGMGLGKEAMCAVAEELSRAYIGVGSLGTRADIAAELILSAGTEEQKRKWLPGIVAGRILPTAAFTEPGSGSDLASITTRATRHGDVYRVYGNKTWITHGARADLMLLLVRTSAKDDSHRGLSLLLAEKPRGTDEAPFPAQRMSGGEIWVLGYRGMKEYEIAFDDFEVPAGSLLGGVEGLGFKQLMATFESSRIQTAARAVGVAQAALDEALRYAQERKQFGKPIIEFPRISDKLAMMAAEIMTARQLTYFAARQKDFGRRCDIEAGMAKLLAARVAWTAADNAVQIHGGNGYAVEFPVSRLLCDARILSIFEGSAEIQAQVIARRLLDEGNPNDPSGV